MKTPFSVTPRVIAHLGEDLIKNESIALLELVKNAYDANARKCLVEFNFTFNERLNSILIEDDGVGMSLNIIKNVWLVIGTDNKKKMIESHLNNGRVPLGEKGIGRLGIHKLGNKISIYTREKGGKEVCIYINWENLYKSKEIDDFLMEIEELNTPKYFPNLKHGTRIEIESLKGDWDRRKLRTVYRDLTSLSSPFSNMSDSFEVKIESNSKIFEDLPSIKKIMDIGMYSAHCTIEGNRITNFKYEFKPWENLTKIQKRTINNLDVSDQILLRKSCDYESHGRSKEITLDLSKYQIGKINLDLIIFERDVSIFSYINMERKTLNDYLRENGGVRVYRNNIRVYNYGEKNNDWLGLDSKRLGRSGGSIGNNLILGAVSINRSESSDLKEKTNREGFIENDAYFAFVDAIKYALDLIIRYRNEDKYNLLSIYKESLRTTEPVIAELDEIIKIVESVVADSDSKKIIKDHVVRIEQQYRNVLSTLIKSANVGLNLGVVVHEMQKQVSSLKYWAENGNVGQIKELADQLEKTVAGYTVFLSNSDKKEMLVSNIVKIVVENNYFRFKAHNIHLYSNYKEFKDKAILSKSESVASLTNLIDNAIYWVSRSRVDNRMIYIYLTSEFKGYVTVAVCDNGPGFKIPPEYAIQPFITGKPMNTGMGLGLHVTHEVMVAMKGKLSILDNLDIELPSKVYEYCSKPTVVSLSFPIDK